jgi:hypothetical protein
MEEIAIILKRLITQGDKEDKRLTTGNNDKIASAIIL